MSDFAKHFADLSDKQLLEVNRADLVAAAQAAFDQELEERGFDLQAEVEAQPALPRAGQDLTSIAEFDNADDAAEAVAALRRNNIPAYIAVVVPEAMSKQALQLLDPGVSDEELERLAESSQLPESEK